jgi:hypothetical protein
MRYEVDHTLHEELKAGVIGMFLDPGFPHWPASPVAVKFMFMVTPDSWARGS